MSGTTRARRTDPESASEADRRRAALAELQQLTTTGLFDVAVRAGIYTEDGQLTEPYTVDKPSKRR
jgi:hypothetical protein